MYKEDFRIKKIFNISGKTDFFCFKWNIFLFIYETTTATKKILYQLLKTVATMVESLVEA